MFGQIKENILYKLDQSKKNPAELKANFAAFMATLKENKGLSDLYEMYNMIETAKFDNEVIAKEFLDECLAKITAIQDNHFRGQDPLEKLRPLAEGVKVKVASITENLDKIVFGNVTLKEKFEKKAELIKSLTDKTQKPDYKEMISNLDKKVTTQVNKLTTEQKEALEVFMENDENKVGEYYNNLIESTIDKIEDKLLNEESVEINKALIATKKKLQQLKSQKPTIAAVDSVIELKADLDA